MKGINRSLILCPCTSLITHGYPIFKTCSSIDKQLILFQICIEINTYGRLVINYVQHLVGRKNSILVTLLDIDGLSFVACLDSHDGCSFLLRPVGRGGGNGDDVLTSVATLGREGEPIGQTNGLPRFFRSELDLSSLVGYRIEFCSSWGRQ